MLYLRLGMGFVLLLRMVGLVVGIRIVKKIVGLVSLLVLRLSFGGFHGSFRL